MIVLVGYALRREPGVYGVDGYPGEPFFLQQRFDIEIQALADDGHRDTVALTIKPKLPKMGPEVGVFLDVTLHGWRVSLNLAECDLLVFFEGHQAVAKPLADVLPTGMSEPLKQELGYVLHGRGIVEIGEDRRPGMICLGGGGPRVTGLAIVAGMLHMPL